MLPQHASHGVILKAGEQSAFDSDRVAAVQALDISAMTWENGMLLAQQMRLADLLDALSDESLSPSQRLRAIFGSWRRSA